MENDALMSNLSAGMSIGSRAMCGNWHLTAGDNYAVFAPPVLFVWFGPVLTVDTPLETYGDVIGFFFGLPSFREMIALGYVEPMVPFQIPSGV